MKELVVIASISQKTGTSKTGRAYTQHKLQDANGEIYSCFDGEIIKPISDLSPGTKVEIEWEQDGKFKNLVSTQPHSNGSLPETYAASRDGEADWDLIGLRKTRCALWDAFMGSQLAASLYLQATKDAGRDPLDVVVISGTRLVVHAERDVFERAPGDDGIPFEVPDDREPPE